MDKKYGEFVGVDNLYYALITEDSETVYSAGMPTYLAPTAEVAGEPKVSTKPTYYDNKPQGNYVTEAETALKLTVANIPAALMAILLGKTYDAASGRVYDTGEAKPPDVAVGFRLNVGKSDYRYYWFLKGNFSGGAESGKSKQGDVEIKNYELTFTALVTTYDGWTQGALKRVFGDTTDSAFVATSWFTQVQTPATASAPAAIAMSTIVPADAATAIVVSAAVVITFNNKIASHSVILLKATDGTVVATTKTFDATGKILTLTPAANMTAATKHIVVLDGVVDVYGQTLAAISKTFTTA